MYGWATNTAAAVVMCMAMPQRPITGRRSSHARAAYHHTGASGRRFTGKGALRRE